MIPPWNGHSATRPFAGLKSHFRNVFCMGKSSISCSNYLSPQKLTAPDLSYSTLSYSTDSTECLGEQKLVCRKFRTKLCLDNLDFVTIFWYCDHSYSSAIRPIKIFSCISHVWCRRWTYEFKIPNHLDQNSLFESLNLGLENVDMGPTQKIIIRLWKVCVFVCFVRSFYMERVLFCSWYQVSFSAMSSV